MSESKQNNRSQQDPDDVIYRADTYTELMIAYGCEAALDAMKAHRRQMGESRDPDPDGGIGLANWDYSGIALTYAAHITASESADWWATQLLEAGVDLSHISFCRSDVVAMGYWDRAARLRQRYQAQIVKELQRDLKKQRERVR